MPTKVQSKSKKKPRKRQPNLRNDAIPQAFLGRELQRQISKFGLSREMAGRIVDDAPSQMSRLMMGHFAEFSPERLVRMLLKLGCDVTITIRRSQRLGRRGRMRVRVT